MILTVTASPFLLSTNELDREILFGEINSMSVASTVAGGFGTGVANVLYRAGMDTLALFPVPEISHYLRLVNVAGLPHEIIPVAGPIPMHLTMRDNEGVETEFRNSPMPLDISQLAMLRDLIVRKAEDATWVLLGGELPAVAPAAWYVDVVRSLRLYHAQVKVAIAATAAPLRAVVRQLAATQPDILIVTAQDLELCTGLDAGSINRAWEDHNAEPVIDASRSLINKGISEILVTIDRRSAILVTSEGAYTANYQSVPGKQGVSWREAFVAGFLCASEQNASAAQRVAYAVAYANADGSEWDNFIPTPDRVLTENINSASF